MNHGFNLMFIEHAKQMILFVQIALDQDSFGNDGGAMPLRQIIVNDGAMPVRHQALNHHTADVTGPAGNQNIHARNSSEVCQPAVRSQQNRCIYWLRAIINSSRDGATVSQNSFSSETAGEWMMEN